MARRVYVVDDEEAIRRASQLMLRVLGYQVGMFDSGLSLLDQIEVLEPGCILLDVRMPQMDGLAVQQRLNERAAPHAVVMMTGHGDSAVAIEAFDQGAAAFLEKPFSKRSLTRALELAFLRLEDPDGFSRQLEEARTLVDRLPDLDQAILQALAGGRSTEGIAADMGLATADVEMRRAAIFSSLGTATLTEALSLLHAAKLASRT